MQNVYKHSSKHSCTAVVLFYCQPAVVVRHTSAQTIALTATQSRAGT